MPETIEKPATTTTPTSGASLMRAADRAAEDRVNTPVKPWTPAPLRPPPHPTVAALKAEAEAVRENAAATAARADSMTQAANAVAQRIDSLERDRTDIRQWLTGIEETDLKALRESARADVHRLYGRPRLDHNQQTTLNGACAALSWTKEVEKELPAMKRDLQTQLEKIEMELASLTATK